MRFRTRPAILMGLMMCLVITYPTLGAKKPGGDTGGGVDLAATLTINDLFTGSLLFSDRGGSYVDWRLENGDPCVFGWVKSDGFFFMYTNRGNDLGLECEQNFPDTTPRRYILRFPGEVCSALGLGPSACDVPAERIRADGLFGRRAQESTVAFMFYDAEGNSYSLDAVGGVTGSGDERTLTNLDRMAQLSVLGQGPKPKPVGPPFLFPFEFKVVRAVL